MATLASTPRLGRDRRKKLFNLALHLCEPWVRHLQMGKRAMSLNSVEPRPIDRRKVVTAIAWTAPAIVVAGAAPAFAASYSPGQFVTLFDTQGANTNQNNTNATTWPHGLLSDSDPSLQQVKFQLGMQMMVFDQSMYNVVPFNTYKNWTSGPITVQLKFDNTVYQLLDAQATWVDPGDSGGTPWTWTHTSTSGTSTTLTFTHAQIAYNGNTLGIPTQTGMFEVKFKLLRNPGVQTAPPTQPANGRTVTNSMQVTLSSGLQSYTVPYVQEDSSQLS